MNRRIFLTRGLLSFTWFSIVSKLYSMNEIMPSIKYVKKIEKLQIYRSDQRLTERRPGFQSFQSFNFAHNFRAGRNGLKALRVFNDDFVDHNTSIPFHPHVNYEILSVVLEGEMSHDDNFGNNILVKPNEVKYMSAGKGLYHGGTCYHGTNFLQIWIEPKIKDTEPVITKMHFNESGRKGKWQLQASPNQADGVLHIKQDIYTYRGSFKQGERVRFEEIPAADVFLVPLSGALQLDDQYVGKRDSAEFITQKGFEIEILQDADLWLMAQPNKENENKIN